MKTSIPKIGKVTLKPVKLRVMEKGTKLEIYDAVKYFTEILLENEVDSFAGVFNCKEEDGNKGLRYHYSGNRTDLVACLEILKSRIGTL